MKMIVFKFRFILIHSRLGGKEEKYISNDNRMIYGPFSQIKLMTRHNIFIGINMAEII